MLPGSYSCRFQTVEKQHVNHLKEQYAEERQGIIARSRKLSADTARRRKALAIKRRVVAQREEKRRQEILSKRHLQIREATEKYQRGNIHYDPKDFEAEATPPVRYGAATPSIEEALAAVRGNSAQERLASEQSTYPQHRPPANPYPPHPRITSAGSVRSVSSGSGRVHYTTVHAPSRDSPTNPNGQPAVQSKPVALQRAQLQSHSLRNLTSSRSLFEQHLEQHQQLLVEEQKQSLHQFNKAIQQEMDRDPKLQGLQDNMDTENSLRCDSPDSVDSLEGDRKGVESPRGYPGSQANGERVALESSLSRGAPTAIPQNEQAGPRLNSASSSSMSGFILHNNRNSQSPVAVVQPQPQPQHRIQALSHYQTKPQAQIERPAANSYAPQKYQDKPEPTATSNEQSSVHKTLSRNGHYNGYHYQDAVVRNVSEVSTDHQIPQMEQNHVYYDKEKTVTADSRQTGVSAATKAWTSPPPVEPEEEHSPVTIEQIPEPKLDPPSNSSASHHRPQNPVTQMAAPQNLSHGTYTVVHSAAPSASSKPTSTRARPLITSATSTSASSGQARSAPLTAPAMEMLKHYSQYPAYKVVDPEEDKVSIQSESSTLVSGSDVAEESQPEPPKAVKGILRKVSSYGGPFPSDLSKKKMKVNIQGSRILRSSSANAILRDSLEVAKNRQDVAPKMRKKNVRFADLCYDDSSDDSGQSTPTAVENPQAASVVQKPPRPASARPAPKPAASPTKIPRVASAGTARRGPFLRPHPPGHPPTGRVMLARTNQKPDNGAGDNVVNGNGSDHGTKDSKPYAVYDANGIRLDRTPTDDEINVLWDTVRTCLSRQSMTSTSSSVQPEVPASAAPTMSQKYIDGNSLAPQYRVASKVNNTYANNYMGTTSVLNSNSQPQRKKVSMDTLNQYSKKAGLLHQRSKQGTASTVSGPSYPSTSTTVQSTHIMPFQQPTHSTAEPRKPAQQNGHGVHSGSVSESMAAFLTAEDLAAGDSLSESQIESAMENARAQQQHLNSNNAKPKVPTALSIEEQRLVQSLERLNERLRLTETSMYPSTTAVPNPPPHKPKTKESQISQYGGFKGRQPILGVSSAGGRRQVNSNGTVPRHYYKGGSAVISKPQGYTGGSLRYR